MFFLTKTVRRMAYLVSYFMLFMFVMPVVSAEKFDTRASSLQITLSSEKIRVGDYIRLKIEGGTAPYSVTAPVNRLEVHPWNTEDIFYLRGIASSMGNPVSVQVSDSKGRQAHAQVFIAPEEVRISAKEIYVGEMIIVNILGGFAPYSLTCDNYQTVAVGKMNEKTYRLTGIAAGTVNITVRDSRKVLATASLLVKERQNQTPGLQASINFSNINLTGPNPRFAIISVSGGKEPYNLTPSNDCVEVGYYSVSSTGAKLYMVAPKKKGHAVISVRDSENKQVPIHVNVL